MARKEFSAKVRDQAHKRAAGKCENKACGAPLQVGRFHYDHILPDALGGKPELANCQCLCDICHKAKTSKEDVPRIRKADRQRRAHIGAKVEPARKIESPGFSKKSKPEPKPSLPPRPMFQ